MDYSAITILRFLTMSSIFVTCSTQPANFKLFDLPYFLTVRVNKYVLLRSQFTSPYLKFQFTYLRLNVCGLQRYEKFKLCHTHLTSQRHELSMAGRTYPNLRCERITVQLDDESEVQVTAFKCPTPYRLKIYDHMRVVLHSSIIYYLSGAATSLYMFAYYRHYGPTAKIKPDIAYSKREEPNFKIFKRVRRNKEYLSAVSLKPTMYHDVTPYRLEERSHNKRYRIPEYAENLTKNFIEFVKNNELPYTKFKRTFHYVNVCGFRVKEHQLHLCGKAFDRDEYDYYVDDHKSELVNYCKQLEITFNYVEFKPTRLWVANCGQSKIGGTVRKSYYISTSVLQKTILGHIRYHPAAEIIPDVLVRNADFNGLWRVSPSETQTTKKVRIQENIDRIPPRRK